MVKPEANVFLWGSHGTGKTLLAMEAVKMKVGHYVTQGRRVRVIVTQYTHREGLTQSPYCGF